MKIVEHSGLAPFTSLMDEMEQDPSIPWGMARVKKNYLRSITDQAFILATTPVLQEADLIHIFFIDGKRTFLVWKSPQKSIYKRLRALIGTTLLQPGSKIQASVVVTPIDPQTRNEELKAAIKSGIEALDGLFDNVQESATAEENEYDHNSTSNTQGGPAALVATSAQIEHYQQLCKEKRYRKQLHILVVEDQIFSQKLLCDVLRSVRAHNNNETPLVDAVDGIQEAWKLYLKKAPDISFVDLGLSDGSGHTLARAMKELDPGATIIIVTANNYEEELSVARQNNVDGFIGKPYNKKQIFDCIERYVGTFKPSRKR